MLNDSDSPVTMSAFACKSCCMKKTTVVRLTVILVPSPFSFSARFSEGNQSHTFYEHFESASQHFPSLE